MAKYVIYKEECFPYGKGSDAQSHPQYTRHAIKSMIGACLAGLTNESTKPSLHLIAKPLKSVICKGKYKVGDLVLFPETMSISYCKKADVPVSASVVKMSLSIPDDIDFVFSLYPPVMNVDESKKSLISPFWQVPKTTDESKVNMELTKVALQLKLDLCTKPKWGSGQREHVSKFEFEMLRNTKPLKENDELFLKASPEEGPQAKKPKKK